MNPLFLLLLVPVAIPVITYITVKAARYAYLAATKRFNQDNNTKPPTS